MRPRRKNASLTAAFTAIELLIALVLLTTVMGVVIQSTERGFALFRESSIRGDTQLRASRALRRITGELLSAGAGTLNPDLEPPAVGPYMGSSSLRFANAEAWAGGVTAWSSTTRLFWQIAPDELDNGVDDNGNGVADEGVLVLVRDEGLPSELSVVLASDVREYLEGELPNGLDDNGNGLTDEGGLSFSLDQRSLVVRLSLEVPDGRGGSLIRTLQSSVSLRN